MSRPTDLHLSRFDRCVSGGVRSPRPGDAIVRGDRRSPETELVSPTCQTSNPYCFPLSPADGSTVGNGSLRGSLADKLGRSVDEAEYLAARDALVDAGSLIKGQGRGGSVRLTTPTAEGESVSEAETPAAKQGRKKKDATPAAVKGSSGMVALTRELWDAAVAMRGTIEPADYKRYVLPIIFLRFLSMRFEKRRAELQAMVADPKSDYFGIDAILEDADEYKSAGTMIVPPNARWSHIVEVVAPADDVKVQVDNVLQSLSETYVELRGLLPRIYAGSNMKAEYLRSLINLFSRDAFTADHGGEDVIGRVYEYFIGEFASSEGKRGGEFFTPVSIVRTLVAMLEPQEGKVFDPCCGSGGMFVQSDQFTKHNQKLSFYGQEAKDFTWRLCKMNLFIHGIDGDIRLGSSYENDQFGGQQFDYIIANPPFNDGSKGSEGWGAKNIDGKDSRLRVADPVTGENRVLPLSPRNANTMWILHFLNHLAPGGTAGFVMATGELSNSELARLEVRKALVDMDYVDCIVQMPGQLFANTAIPCALWFLSKGRDGKDGSRKRTGEILFIDARKLGALIPGSRKQKQYSDEDVEQIAAAYSEFRRVGVPSPVLGFRKVAEVPEVQGHRYALTPGRYVGAAIGDDDDEPFEERFPVLTERLAEQFRVSVRLQEAVALGLSMVQAHD